MGYTPDALRIMRQKCRGGKTPVLISTPSAFFDTFEGDRASLRIITRVMIAFLSRREYAALKREDREITSMNLNMMDEAIEIIQWLYEQLNENDRLFIDRGSSMHQRIQAWYAVQEERSETNARDRLRKEG